MGKATELLSRVLSATIYARRSLSPTAQKPRIATHYMRQSAFVASARLLLLRFTLLVSHPSQQNSSSLAQLNQILLGNCYIGYLAPLILNSTQFLVTLEYWREYRTYYHISQTWKISESTVCGIVKRVENVLIQSRKFSLPGKKKLLDYSLNINLVFKSEIALLILIAKDCQFPYLNFPKMKDKLPIVIP